MPKSVSLNIGYFAEDGSEFSISGELLAGGAQLVGSATIDLLNRLIMELNYNGIKTLVIMLHNSSKVKSRTYGKSLYSEELASYVFSYGLERKNEYIPLLSSSLSFSLGLREHEEYLLRESIRALAQASERGGAFAISQMLPPSPSKVADLVQRRLEELYDISITGSTTSIKESSIAELWQIPSIEARMALALGSACKFTLENPDSCIAVVGWESILAKAAEDMHSSSRLRLLVNELKGRGEIILALDARISADPRFDDLFQVKLKEGSGHFEYLPAYQRGKSIPFFVQHTFSPHIAVDSSEQAELRSVLELVEQFGSLPLKNILLTLLPYLAESSVKKVLSICMQNGYVEMVKLPSGEPSFVITKKGRSYLQEKTQHQATSEVMLRPENEEKGSNKEDR